MRYICKRSEYQSFQQADKVIRSPYFVVLCLTGTEPFVFSVGITVSKKVGCAVVRNHIKRRIKAFLRQAPEIPGLAINIIARAAIANLDWSAFEIQMENLFRDLRKLSRA
jgi:ribonuclease P protein component